MSKLQNRPESATESSPMQAAADESLVVDYLLSHPDFFTHRDDLLIQLRIPHQSGGAISLVERQVSVQREKSQRLEKQLKELLSVARENEHLGLLLHQFAVSLMCTDSVAVLTVTRETALRDFHADQVAFQLFDEDTAIIDVFADMSATHNVVCGQLSVEQSALLFDDADEVASVALILLHAEGNNLGVLALSSVDETRFHPSKGVLFLSQLGSLLSHRLSVLLDNSL